MKKTLLLALIPLLSGCGLLFVNGPPSGWQEIQDPDQLETMRITQPCTTSKGILLLDGFMGGFMGAWLYGCMDLRLYGCMDVWVMYRWVVV